MTLFEDFAHAHGFQPYELAAYLDLGTSVPETLTEAQEAEYAEIVAHGAQYEPPDEVAEAARLVEDAEAALVEARAVRDAAIREEITAGTPVARIAERAGLTRAMVYSIAEGKTRRE